VRERHCTENAELLARVFQDKFHQCDFLEKLCAQDLSNGFQTLGDGTCMGQSYKVRGWKFFHSRGVLSALRPLTLAAKQAKREPKHRRRVWFGGIG